MILTRELLIKINESNFIYYEELGYDVALGESLLIPIELLSTGSHQKISCECDGCGSIKEVIYKNYIKYDNNWSRITGYLLGNTANQKTGDMSG